MKKIITRSFEETRELGFNFAKELKGSEVLALYGDLGSGKTTFMQGLAKGLGIKKNIISPTFIIMRSYKIEAVEHQTLFHLDLYRLESESEARDLGILELIEDAKNIVAIEWPDKIENILPNRRINIYFQYVDGDKREIRFN